MFRTCPLNKQLLARMVPISSLDSGPFIANEIQGIGLRQSWKADKEGIWTEYHSQHDSIDNISSSRLFLAYSLVRETIDLLISGQNKNNSVSLIAYFNERNALISHSFIVIIFSILLLLILLLSLPKFIKLIKKMEVSRILYGIKTIGYYIFIVCLFSILIKLLTYFEIIKYYPEYPGTPKDSYLINNHLFSVLIFYLSPFLFLYSIFSKITISRIDFEFILSLISILFILSLSIFLFRNPESILFFLPGLSINLLLINSNSRVVKSIKISFILLFSYSIISYFLFVFGFKILHINYSIIWYSLLMMSGNMTSFGVLLSIIFGFYLPMFSIIVFLACNSTQKG